MIIANVAVDRVTARVSGCQAIPGGIIGAEVKLEFRDPAWDGLSKTAVFRGNEIRDALITGDTVVIPWETVTLAGQTLYMGVYGIGEAGTLEIPTVWAELGRIEGAAAPSGDPGAEASPELWAQIQGQIGDLSLLETENCGTLVEAINEAAGFGSGVNGAAVRKAVEEALIQAEESGAFDGPAGEPGADGKSAYQYAQSGGYTGTEAEFTARLADSTVYLPVPPEAESGQLICISAVDENGVVTATQAVTLADAEGVEF